MGSTIATPSGRQPFAIVQILVGTTLSIVRPREKTPCRFLDHSDIAGWVCRNRTECPYPQGAPVNMPLKEGGVEEHEKEPTEEDVIPEDAPVAVLEDLPSEAAALRMLR
jgi:hypothetical protein